MAPMTGVARKTLSITMPNYNHARYLPETLESLLTQSRQPDEVIVWDDGSTDDSLAVLERLREGFPIIRIEHNERNFGVFATLNRMIREASGDYVYAAAADDLVLPGFFERCMTLLERHPQAGLCSTISEVVETGGRALGRLPQRPVSERPCYVSPQRARALLMRRGSWIQGNTCIYRRQALLDAGGYRPELGAFCDGFLHLLFALQHGVCFVPEALAVWRVSESGYARAATSNVDSALAMWDRAAELMRTEFAAVFPPEFVSQWHAQQRYVTATQVGAAKQEEFLRAVRALGEPDTAAQTALFGALRASQRAQAALVMAYALVRSPGPMLSFAARRVRRLLGLLN